jgi:hypothetical protein
MECQAVFSQVKHERLFLSVMLYLFLLGVIRNAASNLKNFKERIV